jgi:hypothetical protein
LTWARPTDRRGRVDLGDFWADGMRPYGGGRSRPAAARLSSRPSRRSEQRWQGDWLTDSEIYQK